MSEISYKKVDKPFFVITAILVVVGIFSFISASLGILAKNESEFYSVIVSQLIFGLGGGIIALIIALKVNYLFWRKYAFYIFLGSIILTLMVFVPKLGFSHGGARRWISVAGFSFQPAEFLKIGFVIYFAAWLSWVGDKVKNFKHGALPLFILLGIIAAVLFRQPDTKSFILILIAGLSMYLMSGAHWKNLLIFGVLGLMVVVSLAFFKPYLLGRLATFVDPSRDPSGASYQLEQSEIAIGSGGITGRGYGQSVQKFSYLPEAQGDSIFAVIGEEFGLIGTVSLVFLYTIFGLRGLRIAYRSPDQFSRLIVTGIVIIITAQSFLNIGAIIGVLPLTGVPLVFISHGGTALAITLGAVGIVLNISKFQKKIV